METESIIALIGKIHGKANELIVRELNNRGIAGLAPSHGGILVNLFRYKELTMKELAAKIGKKKNTVTVLVEKLIDLGYVKKEIHPDDKRYWIISLTDKGKNFKNNFDDISKLLIDTVYRNISQPEREKVFSILRKIESNF